MVSKNIQIVLRDRHCGHQESQGASRDSMVCYALRGNSHHHAAVFPGSPVLKSHIQLCFGKLSLISCILHHETEFHFATNGQNIMKFQLLCQYYTKNLGSINCQANGFPFLFCHSHCLLETIAHTEKWILDFDTMVSASFNSRFTVEFLCSAMATQVIDTTVRFPYCFIIRKEKKKHQELSAFPEQMDRL